MMQVRDGEERPSMQVREGEDRWYVQERGRGETIDA